MNDIQKHPLMKLLTGWYEFDAADSQIANISLAPRLSDEQLRLLAEPRQYSFDEPVPDHIVG